MTWPEAGGETAAAGAAGTAAPWAGRAGACELPFGAWLVETMPCPNSCELPAAAALPAALAAVPCEADALLPPDASPPRAEFRGSAYSLPAGEPGST